MIVVSGVKKERGGGMRCSRELVFQLGKMRLVGWGGRLGGGSWLWEGEVS